MSLTVENVKVNIDEYSFSYNFSVNDNEAVAVIGASGCGKTTLLNVISGLIKPNEGRIILNDRDITSLPPYKRNIAYVFQDYALYETLSVKSNIAFPLNVRHIARKEKDRIITSLLETVHMRGFEKRIVSTLSGGEKQRIAIARALASFPQLLLLDEPLSALDPSLRGEMRAFLKEVHNKNGIMTILVTHDKSDAD
ncbi:MAG: ABC transporter ATP-binding protein, partial [Sphaerochaetaceae bacterium]|nr:ABC transporter ATP-binding protein [Sphaerochaetaceae bacterium]